ncbi:MAG: S1 RNA-binding domain-containing protein [Tissierellales bacterium]|jgi:ribosomal protein S1|nr:S1 RNA-binding domain-containing protein [Tissierellales bacterium]
MNDKMMIDGEKYDVVRYENDFPEVYSEVPYLNDKIAMQKVRNSLYNDETVLGNCFKVTKNGDMMVALTSRIIGLIKREDVTYMRKNGNNIKIARDKLSQMIEAKVEKIYPDKDQLGRTVLELKRTDVIKKVKDKYVEELKVGHVLRGRVVGVSTQALFVDVGGDVVGYLHLRDICKAFIKSPREKYDIGDEIDVVVKEKKVLDFGNLSLSFTRQPLFKDFSDFKKEFEVDDVVSGKIKNFNHDRTGLYVEISEDFEGLADFYGDHYYKYGDKVKVKIHQIDEKKRRIKLRILD